MEGDLNMQESQQAYLLEMLEISKEFPGVKALDHVNLRIRAGTEIGRAHV